MASRQRISIDDELWGEHQETPQPTELDEIKQLTESTIRMSGLADIPVKNNEEFDWKVNEPSIKPPSSMSDIGGSSFHLESASCSGRGSSPRFRARGFAAPASVFRRATRTSRAPELISVAGLFAFRS